VPFGLGFLQVWLSERDRRQSWLARIFAPWIPALICLAAALLLAWEGLICVALLTPIALVMASVGGLCAGLLRRRFGGSHPGAMLACCLALPLIVSPLEQFRQPERQIRTVATAIAIDAPAPEIWKHIVRVAPIARAELASSWTQRIGFPRPIEATLSREGVGGIRHASFERGVVFIETITRWEPETALAFRIHADPATIPPGALDEHVTVGGPYFDVLEGEYRIEPAGPRRSTLYLTSRHRLSTHINATPACGRTPSCATCKPTFWESSKRAVSAAVIRKDHANLGNNTVRMLTSSDSIIVRSCRLTNTSRSSLPSKR